MMEDGVKKPSTTIGSTTDTDAGDSGLGDSDLSTFDRKEPRFALADEIGRGGMGRVVAATDVALARSVAIKQMLSDRGDDLARFEREVKITAQLEHPSIVPIHEAGLDPRGRPYYVMRRIEGEQLSARLEGKDTGARLALLPNLLAVVDAAAFAHARKIIHRDIKPSNILLGAYGETWLIDWGLARRLDDLDVSNPRPSGASDLTRAGHVYGTIAYMAPEQARGEPVDERADVYALGATLFHVLAGRGPFASLSEAERIAAAEAGEDRVPLDTLGDEVPPELVAIVDKAMARDPDRRYQHAGELAADLRAFLAGKLVAAHRYTFVERVARFVRQHRFAVFTSLIAVLAMVFVSVLAVGRILAAKDQAEAANTDLQAALSAADERSQTLLLDRASTLAQTDPARAVAIIRQLEPNSPFAARARDILAVAAAHGVPHGATVHDKQINGLAFSADRKWLVSTSEDGRVAIHEVATGNTRIARHYDQGVAGCAWIDNDRKLVLSLSTSLRVLDVQTGNDELVVTASIDRWWLDGAKVRIWDSRRHAIIEVPLAGGAVREVVGNVDFANGNDGMIGFTRNDSTGGVLVGDTVRELKGPIPVPATAIAVSRRLNQVAIANHKEVAAWQLDTGTVLQRWAVPFGMWLAFGPYHPLVINGGGRLISLQPSGSSLDRLTHINALASGQIKTGIAYAQSNGSLYVLDTLGSHTIVADRPGTRVITTTPDAMLVATGTADGGVEWLDLETIIPPPIEAPVQAQLCVANHERLIWASTDVVERYDLASGKRTELSRDARAFVPGFACSLPIGPYVAVVHQLQNAFVDLDRGTTRLLSRESVIAVDAEYGRLLWSDGNDVRERRVDGSEGIRFHAPWLIDRFASRGRWTIVLGDSAILRHDHDANRTETLSERGIKDFGVTPDGSVWVSKANDIHWWRPERTVLDKVWTFDSPAFHSRWVDHKLFLSLTDGSLWTLDKPPPTNRGRRGRRARDRGPGPVAVALEGEHVSAHYLATGEKLSRDVPLVERAWVMEDGRSIVARARKWFIVYKDVVPADFPSALEWAERATNAQFDPSSNSMVWKTTP